MEDFETVKKKVQSHDASPAERKWYYFNTTTVVALMLLAGALFGYLVWQSGQVVVP